ncbi:MAG: TIGR02206 family membrane protein [Verrucomicrobiota bacterium]
MTGSDTPFILFGPAHLTVLFLTIAIPAALIALARHHTQWSSKIGWGLAFVLLANKLAVFTYACIHNVVPWMERLPMQLCDWVTFITAGALIWRNRLLYELAYFWGLAGTLQATITPDLPFGFPEFYFFTFNISHSGIIIAVIFLTLGCGLRPYLKSLVRAFCWVQLYFVTAMTLNYLLDQNYGYLCRKPLNPSLLDHLGPWPWYILSLQSLALCFFAIYYLPFVFWDLYRHKKLLWDIENHS